MFDLLNKKRAATLKKSRGFSLLEIVIATAILATVLLGSVGALTLAIKIASANTAKIQAAYLAEEGVEAVRILRDNGWAANIASQASPFYLSFNGTTWQATSVNQYVDGIFERKVTLSSIYRDGSKKIVWSGGTLDTNAKKITVEVSWLSAGATTTKSISTILANIFNN
ncbi:MAG: prepilin-type N-terminal cleavage/methylation domain-containing protein [Candidatus Paceibacterota bacterium]|jgi:prepilin-type N-terminal cleavage/methylation domain-containing protein